MVIELKPEKIDDYKKLHADVWHGVLKMIGECNIRNYSIYLKDNTLFSYFEYIGNDFDEDMAKMAADAVTRKWWDICKPCLNIPHDRKEGDWWSNMEEVFHYD